MGQGQAKEKCLSKEELKVIKRYVSFTEEEIDDWYSEFCQRSHLAGRQRYVCLEDFLKVYSAVYTSGHSQQFATHVFRTFDLNGDGLLDFQEFLIGMSISGSSKPENVLAWAFRLYDVDSTGYIDRCEVTDIVRSVFRLLGPERLRVDGVVKTAESLAADIFQQLDRDGDERVTWREFCEGAASNPLVVSLLQCHPLHTLLDDKEGDCDVFT